MSTSDPKSPAPPEPAKPSPQTLVTTAGVEVIVKPPPPEPPREPEPERRGPQAILWPEGMTEKEVRSFLDGLCRENAALIEAALDRRNDVLPVSREDLRQNVLLIFCDYVKRERCVPEKLSAWLDDTVQKVVRNHKDRWRPPLDRGADLETVEAIFEEEPDQEVDFELRREKLERYLTFLPEDQAAAIRCTKLYDLTLAETSQSMGLPLSSVADLVRKGMDKLGKLAQAGQKT